MFKCSRNGICDSVAHPDNGLVNTNEAKQCLGKPKIVFSQSKGHCEDNYPVSHQEEQTASKATTGIILNQRPCILRTTSQMVNADFKCFLSAPFSSDKIYANYRKKGHLSDTSCHLTQSTDILPTLVCGQLRAQNLDDAHSSVCGQQMYSPPLSTCGLLSTGVTDPPTDKQIQSLIAEKLAYFRTRNDSFHGSATTDKEYPQIRMEVATYNTQHQEGCPIVEVTKHPAGINESRLQNENLPVWSNVSSKPEHCQDTYAKPNVSAVKATNTGSENTSEDMSLIEMIKDPQYEDISDDGEIFKNSCQKPQYEDISDDESPTFGIPSATEPKVSLLNRNTHRQQTEEERQMDQSVLPMQYPLEHLEDNAFCVIPLHLLSLTYEPPKEPHDCVIHDTHATRKTKQQGAPFSPPSASSLEVYESPEIYQQVNSLKFADHFEVLEDDIDEKNGAFQQEEPLYAEHDSGETEDSCDYSSASEHNYLTVSKRLLDRSVSSGSEESSDIRQHCEHKSGTEKEERMQSRAGCKKVKRKDRKLTDAVVTDKVEIRDSSEDENAVQLIDETTDSLHVQIGTSTSSPRGSVLNLDLDEKEHGHVTKGKKRLPSGSPDITDDFFVPYKKHPS